jgi:hypothetical protein
MLQRLAFSAMIGGVGGEFSFDVEPDPLPGNIPYTPNPNSSITIFENTIPNAIFDPNFIGINITKGDLGSFAYLVHVDFDIYQTTGSNKTYTLYLFRGSSVGFGGTSRPNRSAGKVTIANNSSGEWGATWIVPPTQLGDNKAIRIQLAADVKHSVQFQKCLFRIERLG